MIVGVGVGVGAGVAVRSTSGPVATQRECEMMMSPAAIMFARCTWMALTVIEVLRPGEFDRICSLKVTDPSPGTAMLVFGAGFADSPGRFVPRMVVLPVEPGPEAVQLLLITVAVNWPLPSLTFAVLAELFAVLVWEPSRLLEVDTVSTPVDNSIGTVADANLFVKGPPPPAGSVTWGIGPELTGTFPASSFAATLSP